MNLFSIFNYIVVVLPFANRVSYFF